MEENNHLPVAPIFDDCAEIEPVREASVESVMDLKHREKEIDKVRQAVEKR